MEVKEQFYLALNGDYVGEEDRHIAGIEVRDEFIDGRECERLSSEAYSTKEAILRKLHVEEDKDLERIFDNLSAVTKIVAEKMFEYGMMYANRE